jgi:hypothetical protein
MIIIGCDFHTRFQRIAMLAPPPRARSSSATWNTRRAKRRGSTLPFRVRLVWGSKQPSTHSGSNECSVSISTSCRLEMRLPRASRVRMQKTDVRQMLRHLHKLMG